MSKAAPSDVTAMGFDANQFGGPDDFDAYIQAILDNKALIVRSHVGAGTYDAAVATTLNGSRMSQAEIYYTCAEMYRRLEIFERTTATRSRDAKGAETIGSRLLKTAEEFEERAEYELAQITGSRPGSSSATLEPVESGRFASTQ